MPLFTLITSNGLLTIDPSDGSDILFLIIKFMFITAGVLYLLFSILIVRQVGVMSKTLSTTASPRIKLLATAHLIATLLVLIYFLLVL